MPEMRLTPVNMRAEDLLAVLDDIRERVAEGDSFEGNLTYSIPDEAAPVGSFDVQASYRIGNQMGQGGMRVIGEWRAVTRPAPEALYAGEARCSAVVPDPDSDPEEDDALHVDCGALSRFQVSRSDGDKSYGINGGSEEACEEHLAEAVAGMVDGDEGIRAVVTVRWDGPAPATGTEG